MKTRNALYATTFVLMLMLIGLPVPTHAIPVQVAKLVASDGAPNGGLGNWVSISGDTAIVGAPYTDVGGYTDQGAAYIFYRDKGGPDAWGQVAKLTEPGGGSGDYFGSVALDGDTAVVGAPFWGGNYHGRAYVYYRNQDVPDAWGLVTTLTAADGAGGDFYGGAVAVDGDTILIGANQWYSKPGAVYVYYRNQGGSDAWGQVAKLTASDGGGDEYFGAAVALQGDTAVIAAPYAPAAGETARQGKVYIFYRDKGDPKVWREVAKLTASDAATNDLFGIQVRLSGDTAIIGAPVADVSGNINQGAAYIFYRNQGGSDAWGQVTKLTASVGGPHQCFGSVSISGDTAIVGRSFADGGCYGAQGVAYIYRRNQGGPDAWGQTDMLVSDEPGDGFGVGVSLSGNTAVVGAWGADVGGNVDQGAAYVYDLAQPPTAVAGGPYTVAEGDSVTLDGTGSYDADPGDILTHAWDLDNDGVFETQGATPAFAGIDGPASHPVALQVCDSSAACDVDSTTVEVANVAPTIDAIDAPVGPANIDDQPVGVDVVFSDPGTPDTHDVTWEWGDGSSDTQTGVTSPASASHTYIQAGVNSVTVTVTDDDGGSGSQVFQHIVIYDPSAGFVTGGGWIQSPAGAYKPAGTLAGKANFGFVSKYKKGAQAPAGNTEFQFPAAGLNFHSNTYEWLVVTGGNYARCKGAGTINGQGAYHFMFWAGDGAADSFRIKIWTEDEFGVETVVYDNGADQPIGRGSIVIHTGGKGLSANDAEITEDNAIFLPLIVAQ